MSLDLDSMAQSQDQILYDCFLKNQSKKHIDKISQDFMNRMDFEKTIEIHGYLVDRLRREF